MGAWDEAMERLVAEYGSSLVGYGRLLTGGTADGEDLVHDALVRVFTRMPGRVGAFLGRHRAGGPLPLAPSDQETPAAATAAGFPTPVSPMSPLPVLHAYVRRTMLTMYIDETRRRERWRTLRVVAASPHEHGDHATSQNARHDVLTALSQLSAMQRACTVLRYYDDLTVPQVAAALGISTGTAKRHLHDALSRLRSGPLGTTDEPAPTDSKEDEHVG